jgi:GNAT superfamily N-acetyltransferase
MSEVSVNPVRAEDMDALVASVAGLFAEDGGANDPLMDSGWPAREGARYYAGLMDDPTCLVTIARDGDRVVGHLVGRLTGPDAILRGRVAVLESVRVHPDHRGRGAGTRLVEEFFTWARRREAVRARVTAYVVNDGARHFYRRHGFAPASVTFTRPL